MSTTLRINGDRLLQHIAEMAEIGATSKGGVCRVALTNADRAGRDLFIDWCRKAGCTVRIDRVGNIFARRPGTHEDLPGVLIGSHLDSQPTGGKYDGAYGVLAALEVIETLNDAQVETLHPIEIVSWTNEEGARFAPGLTGSGVFAGEFELDRILSISDKDGKTFGEELKRIGYAGQVQPGSDHFKAAIELHIEQGPVLEAEDVPIGVVTGVQGMYWYDLVFTGQEAHAGTTPMDQRSDPVLGAVRILQKLYALNAGYAPDGRVTFGDIQSYPGSRNTVPGCLRVTLDFRHPDAAVLSSVDQQIRDIVNHECLATGLQGQVEEIWYMPPVSFSELSINAVQAAADRLGYTSKSMTSGAGHDAMYLSRVMPTGMIFVPSEKGLSHNELEYTKPEHLIAGCNVLLHTVLTLTQP
jgi:N-carbamoyl-L-amino-acid hydrolase